VFVLLLIANKVESAEARLSLSWISGHDPCKESEVQIRSRVEQRISKPRKVHVFNCDRTYKLDAVEDWLMRTEPKLGFEFSVEQHYFSLPEMFEWSSKMIPFLQMDLAVFVVRAHESYLSITEDDAGTGYSKIYRALLQATGKSRFTLCTNKVQVWSWAEKPCIHILEDFCFTSV